MFCREVRGEDHEPAVLLDPLEQEGDLLVGVPVVGVVDLGALAEQRVGLVEEEDPAAVLGLVEHRARFFSVSPMYFERSGQVDLVDVAARSACPAGTP